MPELLEKVLAEANSQSYDQSTSRESISPMSESMDKKHSFLTNMDCEPF